MQLVSASRAGRHIRGHDPAYYGMDRRAHVQLASNPRAREKEQVVIGISDRRSGTLLLPSAWTPSMM